MKLYYHPVSPYSRKARVATLMRGDGGEAHVVDLRAGELGSAEYLARSPFGKMPVLVTDDEGPIFESTSIVEYLEEKGPRVLLPRGAERLARHWDRIGDLYLMDPQSILWFRPTSDEAPEARETVHKAWALLAAQLAGKDFVVGRHFTMGDLSAAIASDYLVRLGEEPPAVVRAWIERCFAIPAMAAGLEEALPMLTAMLARRQATA